MRLDHALCEVRRPRGRRGIMLTPVNASQAVSTHVYASWLVTHVAD